MIRSPKADPRVSGELSTPIVDGGFGQVLDAPTADAEA